MLPAAKQKKNPSLKDLSTIRKDIIAMNDALVCLLRDLNMNQHSKYAKFIDGFH
jgi:hypothetical protein